MAVLSAEVEEFTLETRDVSPAHLLIKVEAFSMLPKHGIRKYVSSEFAAGDYKWRLTIYFDGDESGNEGDHISAYVSMVETSSLHLDWEVNASFNIFLFNQISDNYLCFRGKVQRFHAMKSKRGFQKMLSKKVLIEPSNGYLSNDTCVFGAEVFVIKSHRVIESMSVLKITDPYKREWKIAHFPRLVGVWTSEQFSAEGYRWKIKLYPNGNGRAEGRSVSIYMECVDAKSFAPHQQVKADIWFRLKNKLPDTSHALKLSHWFTSSVQSSGFDEFIPITDLHDPGKGFLVDDRCFLETEISVQAVVHRTPNGSNVVVWD